MRSALLVVAALVVTAAPVRAADELFTHAAIAAYTVAGFVDIATTEYAIGRGVAREANPIFRAAVERGPVTAGAVKGAAHVAIAWWLLHDHAAHPRRARVVASLLALGQVAVDVSNAHALRGR